MYLLIIIIIVIAILCLEKIIENKQNTEITADNGLNYIKNDYLLTKTELNFYRELIKITNELNLVIFPKIRLADIFKHNELKDFNKIKSKHIDFLLCDKSNCKIRLAIELDDYSHNTNKALKNDNFKNEIFKQTNLPLIRIKVNNIYNIEELKEKIDSMSIVGVENL